MAGTSGVPDAGRARLVRAGIALLAAGALALAISLAQRAPEGPLDVPLDRVACARCGMLVSEASFAGQLHTRQGDVLFYDDPGCLLLDLEARGDAVAAHWFHDHDSARWLAAEEVGFARVEPSPMGYGLAARARAPELLDAAQALAQARERDAARVGSAP